MAAARRRSGLRRAAAAARPPPSTAGRSLHQIPLLDVGGQLDLHHGPGDGPAHSQPNLHARVRRARAASRGRREADRSPSLIFRLLRRVGRRRGGGMPVMVVVAPFAEGFVVSVDKAALGASALSTSSVFPAAVAACVAASRGPSFSGRPGTRYSSPPTASRRWRPRRAEASSSRLVSPPPRARRSTRRACDARRRLLLLGGHRGSGAATRVVRRTAFAEKGTGSHACSALVACVPKIRANSAWGKGQLVSLKVPSSLPRAHRPHPLDGR